MEVDNEAVPLSSLGGGRREGGREGGWEEW